MRKTGRDRTKIKGERERERKRWRVKMWQTKRETYKQSNVKLPNVCFVAIKGSCFCSFKGQTSNRTHAASSQQITLNYITLFPLQMSGRAAYIRQWCPLKRLSSRKTVQRRNVDC